MTVFVSQSDFDGHTAYIDADIPHISSRPIRNKYNSQTTCARNNYIKIILGQNAGKVKEAKRYKPISPNDYPTK